MKCKKIIALAAALTQLCVFVPATHAASVETDTVVYNYDYTQYADGTAAKAKGITPTGSSWGTPKNDQTVGDKQNVYWIGSPKATYSALTDIAKVDIVSDNKDAIAASENDMIVFDIDYGVRLSQTGSNEIAKLRFTGNNEEGTEESLAAFTMNIAKNSNTGTAYFEEAKSVTVPYIGVLSSDKSKPGQRSNLRIAFDMKNKTYSAWFIKRAEYGDSAAVEDEPALMVSNVPMACGSDSTVKYPSLMYYSIQNNAGSDVLAPVSMKTTILSDASVVAASKDALTVADTAEKDITLPALLFGSDIAWSSDNADVIANDGKVTRPEYGESDAIVTLTASITRGTAEETKTFTVTVPAMAFVPDVSDNGIWTIDNMEYASSADIPTTKEASKFYYAAGTASTIAEKEDVTEEALSDTAVNGYIYADNGMTVVRAGSVYEVNSNAQDATVTKYLSQTAQHSDDDLVLEFEYERIGSPNVYIAVQALNSWKGPATVNNTAAGTLSTYGQASTSGKTVNKVTFVFNGSAKTYDTYFNGVLYKSGQAYRYTDAGTVDISRIGFTVKGDSKTGDGIKIHYVRFIDKDAYGKWALEHESTVLPAAVDAYTTSITLPASGSYNNKITWTSSDENAIDAKGTVKHGSEDVTVTMSGTYTNIVTGDTKIEEYTVIVEKAGEMTAEVAPIGNVTAGGTANVKINMANASAEEKPTDVYYAFYDADGALMSLSIDNLSVKTGRDSIDKELSVPDKAVSVKALVWTPHMGSYAIGVGTVTAAE